MLNNKTSVLTTFSLHPTERELYARKSYAALCRTDPNEWSIVSHLGALVWVDFADPESKSMNRRWYGQCRKNEDGTWFQAPFGHAPVLLWKRRCSVKSNVSNLMREMASAAIHYYSHGMGIIPDGIGQFNACRALERRGMMRRVDEMRDQDTLTDRVGFVIAEDSIDDLKDLVGFSHIDASNTRSFPTIPSDLPMVAT